MIVARLLVSLALLAAGSVVEPQSPSDTTATAADHRSPWQSEAEAVRDELRRGLAELRLADGPEPYFAQARIQRLQAFTLDGSYGGLITDLTSYSASGHIDVRVGSAERDNTGFFGPSGDRDFSVPLTPHPVVTRRAVWLAMDAAFRDASTAYTTKQGILSRLANERLPADLGPAPAPLHRVPWAEARDIAWPPTTTNVDAKLRDLVRALSARFSDHPDIDNGDVIFQRLSDRQMLVDSESLLLGSDQTRAVLGVIADTRAADGMHLDHGAAIHLRGPIVVDEAFIAEAEQLVDRVLEELAALREAPMLDEDYDGPVLFSPQASAKLLASTVALHASGSPVPLGESGPMTKLEPHWQSRLGKIVLPTFLDLVDDPTASGFGSYTYDAEGFVAEPLVLVERGQMSELLMTRRPNQYIARSNGRARITPAMRYDTAISNLKVVSHKRGQSLNALERELLARAREDGYEFAYIVEDFRDASLLGPPLRDGASLYGDARKVTMPLPARVFRIDANGRRTLVRGALFSPASMRVFRRIRAVGRDEEKVRLRVVPGPEGGFAVSVGIDALLFTTVDAQVETPALLIDGFELLVERGEHERLPLLVHPLRASSVASE